MAPLGCACMGWFPSACEQETLKTRDEPIDTPGSSSEEQQASGSLSRGIRLSRGGWLLTCLVYFASFFFFFFCQSLSVDIFMTAQFDSLKTSSVQLREMNNKEGVCHLRGVGFFILLYCICN